MVGNADFFSVSYIWLFSWTPFLLICFGVHLIWLKLLKNYLIIRFKLYFQGIYLSVMSTVSPIREHRCQFAQLLVILSLSICLRWCHQCLHFKSTFLSLLIMWSWVDIFRIYNYSNVLLHSFEIYSTINYHVITILILRLSKFDQESFQAGFLLCVDINVGALSYSGTTKYSKLIVHVPCPRPGTSHLSKEPWFLFLG